MELKQWERLIEESERQIINGFVEYKIDDGYTAKIYNAGSGEPVLFTPVFDNTTFIYAAQIKYFEQKYRVITYTPRESTEHRVDAKVFADDILAIIKTLGLKKVNVVTMCVTCSNTLLAYIKEPDLFGSFFITNAFVYMPLPKLFKKFTKVVVSLLPENLAKRILVRYIALPSEQKIFLPRFLETRDFKKKFYNGVLPMLNTDIRAELARIKAPVAVITTEYDPFIPVKYTKLIHDNIPGSSFEVIPNTRGHFLSLSEPELFNTKLEAFLKHVSEAGNNEVASTRA